MRHPFTKHTNVIGGKRETKGNLHPDKTEIKPFVSNDKSVWIRSIRKIRVLLQSDLIIFSE